MIHPFSAMPAVMNATARDVDTGTTRIMKKAMRAIGETAVRTTRVDTGRARSNWVVQIDNPFRGEVPAYAPGNNLGISEGANASAAISQQQAAIAVFDSRRHRAMHLTNNTPYIGILNDGGPRVPPGNMVEKAIQSAEISVAGEAILTKVS